MMSADADEIRERADEILSRPEYQEAEPSLLERFFRWLSEPLGELFGSAAGVAGGRVVGFTLLAVALAIVVYVLWRVVPRSLPARKPGRPTVEHTVDAHPTRSQWLRRAGQAEQEQRWDEAVHARYHALTAGLADEEQLSPETSATAGEHREHFTRAASPDQARVFVDATDTFERIWFGGLTAQPDHSRSLADADRRLLDQGR